MPTLRVLTLGILMALTAAACSSAGAAPPGAGWVSGSPPVGTTGPGTGPSAPNIVFVLTDDLTWNLVSHMPHVLAMERTGVTFKNYFVTDSLCCPSRTSIFTGEFPHDTSCSTTAQPHGGFRGVPHGTRREQDVRVQPAGTGLSDRLLRQVPQRSTSPQVPYRGAAAAVHPAWLVGMGRGRHAAATTSSTTASLWDTRWPTSARRMATTSHRAVQEGEPVHRRQLRGAPAVHGGALHVLPALPVRAGPPGPGRSSPTRRLPAVPHTATPSATPRPWLKKIGPLRPLTERQPDQDVPAAGAGRPVGRPDDRPARGRGHAASVSRRTPTSCSAATTACTSASTTSGQGKETAFDTDIRVPLIVTGPGVRPAPPSLSCREHRPGADVRGPGGCFPSADGGRPLAGGAAARTAPPGWRTAVLVEHHGPMLAPADPDYPASEVGEPAVVRGDPYRALSLRRVRRRRAGVLRPHNGSLRAAQPVRDRCRRGSTSRLHDTLVRMSTLSRQRRLLEGPARQILTDAPRHPAPLESPAVLRRRRPRA